MSEVMDLSNLYLKTKLAPGAEVVLLRDVERYPHFIAERGSRGVVSQVIEEVLAVRMFERLPGAEEWDNEVHWYPGNGDVVDGDLALCSECPTYPYWPRARMSDDVVWVTGLGQMGYAVMRGDRCIHDGLDSIGEAEALAAVERAPVVVPDADAKSLPTVWLVIGASAICRDARGELVETVEFDNAGHPLWEYGGGCDHRGEGGIEGYEALVAALDAAEKNASLCGLDVVPLGEGWAS